jgi:hypothetical protein
MLFTLSAAHTQQETTEDVLYSYKGQMLAKAADLPASLTQ